MFGLCLVFVCVTTPIYPPPPPPSRGPHGGGGVICNMLRYVQSVNILYLSNMYTFPFVRYMYAVYIAYIYTYAGNYVYICMQIWLIAYCVSLCQYGRYRLDLAHDPECIASVFNESHACRDAWGVDALVAWKRKHKEQTGRSETAIAIAV